MSNVNKFWATRNAGATRWAAFQAAQAAHDAAWRRVMECEEWVGQVLTDQEATHDERVTADEELRIAYETTGDTWRRLQKFF